jgi:hypothetical protein
MGTTRSFLLLKNRGFTREELEHCSALRSEERPNRPAVEIFSQFLNSNFVRQMPPETQELMRQMDKSGQDNRAVIAFQPGTRWLPYFETWLCDGNIVSSEDLQEVSEQFGTAVLAFAVFDSDILFISYCDAEQQVFYDFVKPNYPEIEEYDTEIYQEGLPAFLLSLDKEDNVQQMGDLQRLKDIWDEEDMVFADDRMHNILQFLGMQVICDENDIPESFTRIGG